MYIYICLYMFIYVYIYRMSIYIYKVPNTDKSAEQLELSCMARGIAKCTVTLGRFGSLLENHHMSQQSHHGHLLWRNENLGSHKNLSCL